MLTTYWDLTERQRAALTRDDVARYLDAELMTNGVLRPAPLELLPEEPPPVAARTFYGITHSGWQKLDLAFATAEDAHAFLAMRPMILETNWELGDIKYAHPIDGKVEVLTVADRDAVVAATAILKERKAAKEENKRRREAFEKQQKAVESALSGLWEDWHDCCAKDREMRRIAATFAEYKVTAGGDDMLAAKFLRKVFTVEQIADAERWTGVEMYSKRDSDMRVEVDDAPAQPEVTF